MDKIVPPGLDRSPFRRENLPLELEGSALSSYLHQNSRGLQTAHIRLYPDGGLELVLVPSTPRAVGRREERRTAARDVAAANGRRAACKVKRKARWHDLRVMWTATFPGKGVHDYDEAYRLLSRFLHDHRALVDHRRCGYVAVPELHPRGHGYHWHVLLGETFSKRELHRLQVGWTRFLSRRGHVASGGAQLVRHHVRRFSSARSAGSYAGKYVAKAMTEGGVPSGRQRYLTAEGLTIPPATTSSREALCRALRICEHSFTLERFYDGRGEGLPFLYLGFGPAP